MDVNPFASPQTDARITRRVRLDAMHDRVGPWHNGKLLIVGHKTTLPPRCVKCNAPTELPLKRFRLAWHSPFVYLAFVLLGPLAYIAVALIFRRKMTVQVGICDYHRFHRRLAILAGVLGTFLGFGLVIAGGMSASGLSACGRVARANHNLSSFYTARIVWPKRIDKQFAQLRSTCPSTLPNCRRSPFEASSSDTIELCLGDHDNPLFPLPVARGRPSLLSRADTMSRILSAEAAAEFLGTFTLIVFGVGVVAQVVLGGGTHGEYLSINLGWGLAVTMGGYVAGGISGRISTRPSRWRWPCAAAFPGARCCPTGSRNGRRVCRLGRRVSSPTTRRSTPSKARPARWPRPASGPRIPKIT